MHLRALDTPNHGRNTARNGRIDEMQKVYQAHLTKPEAREGMDEPAAVAKKAGPVCILYYEHDHRDCHRRMIAEIVEQRTGAKIGDLQAPQVGFSLDEGLSTDLYYLKLLLRFGVRRLMRIVVALRLWCIAVAMAACAAAAQEADDNDAEPAAVAQNASFWTSLLTPTITATPSFDFLTGGMPDRMLYFSGIELQRWSLGAYAGAQWAPGRIDREGFILRMVMSDSIERFTAPNHRYDTQIFRGTVMPGYKFSHNKFELQVLGGIGSEIDAKSADRAAATWRVKIGAQVAADLWWEPMHALMLQTSISATTIDSGYSTRVAAGWRLFERFWIGPELTASQDYFSRQTRVGAHLTGLRTNQVEWSVAAGRVWDSYAREGVYGRIGVVIRPARPMHLD
ncbi:hypothetical protein BH11PSE4_BH11PSE4_44390 [soil metagenome]